MLQSICTYHNLDCAASFLTSTLQHNHRRAAVSLQSHHAANDLMIVFAFAKWLIGVRPFAIHTSACSS